MYISFVNMNSFIKLGSKADKSTCAKAACQSQIFESIFFFFIDRIRFSLSMARESFAVRIGIGHERDMGKERTQGIGRKEERRRDGGQHKIHRVT